MLKSERVQLNFNTNWLFALGDHRDAQQPDYIDQEWELVHLPHTVALTPAISSGGRNYQGIAWYRKHFTVPNEYRRRKLYIEFEAAMQVAEVWVNGRHLTTHACGYTPFTVDISDCVHYDAVQNVIAVRLDNSDLPDVPPGKPQGTLDFSYDGGIYRSVNFVVTDRLHITDPVYANIPAGGGIFVTFPLVTAEMAEVNVKTHVINEYAEAKAFRVEQRLIAADGQVVAAGGADGLLQAGAGEHYIVQMQVLQPHLWHPYEPYLYKLVTTLLLDDRAVDEQVTRIGIRTFSFSPTAGFSINGRQMKVMGANYHQSYVYIGNALPKSLLHRDARKLREAGFAHIRAAHYPLDNEFMDTCDEIGMLTTVCAPGWQWFRDNDRFVQQAYQNVRDMVRRDRNHPCVILWEPILNESKMPDWFEQAVHQIVHEEYPVDPCYTGSDRHHTDVMYRNFQEDKPIWQREYGDYPDNWSDQNGAGRVKRGWGDFAQVLHVEHVMGYYLPHYTNPRMAGFGVWPGIEHNRGYHMNPCWGGVYDLYRIRKFLFYYFRSQQDPDAVVPGGLSGPMVFIANWWGEVSPRDVTVYTNCEEVRLYHNDELVDTKRPEPIPIAHPPVVFPNVWRLKKRGRAQLRAEGLIDGKVVATDQRYSPGVARRLSLAADFMGRELVADGSDMVMVYCRVLDNRGNIVPQTADDHPIKFSVEGAGTIVGDASIGANPICPEAGEIGILVRSTLKPGLIRIKAELLWPQRHVETAVAPAELEITSQPMLRPAL